MSQVGAQVRTTGLRSVGGLDLSARTVAKLLGCHPKRVKRMAAEGAFGGAYRLEGREWRIPEGSVAQYRADQVAAAEHERAK